MSTLLPSRPRHVGQRRTFAIVSSQYNPEFVTGLVEHAKRELGAISSGFQLLEYAVPGAFEIPLVVQRLATRNDIDGIIALGVIIEGETQHASLIGSAITNALMKIALDHDVPVIHEVLLLHSTEQARKRCLEDDMNRGTEAARVAVRMAQVMSEVGGGGR